MEGDGKETPTPASRLSPGSLILPSFSVTRTCTCLSNMSISRRRKCYNCDIAGGEGEEEEEKNGEGRVEGGRKKDSTFAHLLNLSGGGSEQFDVPRSDQLAMLL